MILQRKGQPQPAFIIEEVTDAAESERARLQHERFSRNVDWLQAHWSDVLPAAYDKYVAVAGQQAFIANSAQEARALAQSAHREGDGVFIRYIRSDRSPRIYANQS